MIYPSIDELLKKVDSKYSLVVIAAKRARELLADENYSESKNRKSISVALQEIMEDKIVYKRLKENKFK
ncbi:DNA-directed RNA polymerase subunit omega [Anaerobranca californiensis DSM 14826]|jgi:DNA-directed RNA polymerase subunit omega|uniref:DNA-directed RNA polymerase subunit omega n=1 Tax=Anaerobranca californiensis DSM 14826 TaxID=1120989 RepID=A0A1M6KR34_9FIRM|nr:DNA-directed RNA polymerase subunit omega [Anaerobranca californiensis]SHJ61418.1 DNA-directed RNA polymerase subunit omega [Anaerobranca californiensis DSM 14826]